MAPAAADNSLDLPPSFRAIPLRELSDAFEHAMAVAPEHGAGTLVWTRRFDLVEAAVVLEPEEPLQLARKAIYLGMNAAANALATHCPPEKPITFVWPDTIMLDRGLIGGCRLGWPAETKEEEPPQFLVLGLMIRLMMTSAAFNPNWAASADRTSLEAEGFEILDAAAVIGSFARHLMSEIDRWQHTGFKQAGSDYLARLAPHKLVRRGIDTNGDLLSHKVGVTGPADRRELIPALETCAWLDRATGEPLE